MWVGTGIGLPAIADWVQQSGFSLSAHFNHNDLFHLIQAPALIGFFRVPKLMSPTPQVDGPSLIADASLLKIKANTGENA